MSTHFFALLFLTFGLLNADPCMDCVGSGEQWCVESSECNKTISSCATLIKLPLNCPSLPDPKNAYDDNFMRTQQMVITTATQCSNPQLCFDNQIPTMKLYQRRTANCSTHFSDVTCVGYTAFDVTQKAIVIAFKGAHGRDQIELLLEEVARYGMKSYFNNNAKIFIVIYDWFMLLWNGGMSKDLRELKYKYPDFELWVNGHSLGAALTWTASSFIATSGLYKPEQMKVVALGAPRLGDYNFAVWHSATFPYCYHIVHRLDSATRFPSIDPHSLTKLYHPRTEVWYDNYMNVSDPYTICEESDGDYCSDAVTTGLIGIDHLYYFNINIPDWGRDGCPKNSSDYAQS
ncbi:unnamed protein product [Caenorhabditis sp. 36 PRJEB53466]|nr:unnamed protein product [Caenorhabditis sp. 36 PRJEB53466]